MTPTTYKNVLEGRLRTIQIILLIAIPVWSICSAFYLEEAGDNIQQYVDPHGRVRVAPELLVDVAQLKELYINQVVIVVAGLGVLFVALKFCDKKRLSLKDLHYTGNAGRGGGTAGEA